MAAKNIFDDTALLRSLKAAEYSPDALRAMNDNLTARETLGRDTSEALRGAGTDVLDVGTGLQKAATDQFKSMLAKASRAGMQIDPDTGLPIDPGGDNLAAIMDRARSGRDNATGFDMAGMVDLNALDQYQADKLTPQRRAAAKEIRDATEFDRVQKLRKELDPYEIKTAKETYLELGKRNIQKEKLRPGEIEKSKLVNQKTEQEILFAAISRQEAADRHGMAVEEFDLNMETAEYALETAKTAEDRKDALHIIAVLKFGHDQTTHANAQTLFGQKQEDREKKKAARELQFTEDLATLQRKSSERKRTDKREDLVRKQRRDHVNATGDFNQKAAALFTDINSNNAEGISNDHLKTSKVRLINEFDLQLNTSINNRVTGILGKNTIRDIAPAEYSAGLRQTLERDLVATYQETFEGMPASEALTLAKATITRDKQLTINLNRATKALGLKNTIEDRAIQGIIERNNLNQEDRKSLHREPNKYINSQVRARMPGVDWKNESIAKDLSTSIDNTFKKLKGGLKLDSEGMAQLELAVLDLYSKADYDGDLTPGNPDDFVLSSVDNETDISRLDLPALLQELQGSFGKGTSLGKAIIATTQSTTQNNSKDTSITSPPNGLTNETPPMSSRFRQDGNMLTDVIDVFGSANNTPTAPLNSLTNQSIIQSLGGTPTDLPIRDNSAVGYGQVFNPNVRDKNRRKVRDSIKQFNTATR